MTSYARTRLSDAVTQGLYHGGGFAVSRRLLRRTSAVILRYHSVCEDATSPLSYIDPGLSVPLEAFDRQMRFLREHYAANFEHVSLRNFSKDANTGRWLAATPDFLSQPERLFNTIPAEPIVTPDEMRFSSVLRQELARNLAEVNKAQSELCDHHIAELEKLRKDLPEMIRKAAGVDVAEAKLAQATEQLESLNQQKSAMSVTSPGHGIVGAYSKQVADPVGVGEALVTIHDRERPFVEVDVPSREVIKLQIGETLRLDFAGEDRTGRVEFICPQAHNRNGDADSWITVRVRPAGKLWPEVAIGSAVAVRMK
jgi:hypothetical protein